MFKKISAIIAAAVLAASLTACAGSSGSSSSGSSSSASASKTTSATAASTSKTTSADAFTAITEAGIYVVSGSAKNASIIVEAGDDDKVQIVLSGASITNDSSPAIYVKNADKVFVTTAGGSENTLTVSGSFTADGDTNTDAVIFSKDDLVLNGEGTLTISSTDNGISDKDDLKITGGTIKIDCIADAIEANETIAIAGGDLTINTQKDGIHAGDNDDDTVGDIYISGGTFNITAGSDGIQGTTTVVIDGGTFDITSAEGIEATNITINDGTINISASDDGINAAAKSSAQSVVITINGGNITIKMGQGDTDGIDSNGDLYITGGTIDITGQSACDYDGKAEKTGGTLIVNGSETDTIPNQMMGGHGGMGGDRMNDNRMNGGFNMR